MLRKLSCVLFALSGSAPAATISHHRLDSGIELIEIEGDIQAGDEVQFRRIAGQFDKALVGFNSDGGALYPALEMGRALHLQGFDTAVISGNRCASACALIWAAGTNRYLVQGGRVGFHASYVEDGGKTIETGLGNALVGRYLTQLGLSEKTIIFATYAHPDSIAWLKDRADAEASGIPFSFSIPTSAIQSPASATARAESSKPSTRYTTIESWDIYRNSIDCAAVSTFVDSSVLGIHYFAKERNLVVTFTYPSGNSLSEGDQRKLDIRFLTQKSVLDEGWKNVTFSVTIDSGTRFLTSQYLLSPALADFVGAKSVGFFYQGKRVAVYNLAGISGALAEVEKCSNRVNHIDANDVFAQ